MFLIRKSRSLSALKIQSRSYRQEKKRWINIQLWGSSTRHINPMINLTRTITNPQSRIMSTKE